MIKTMNQKGFAGIMLIMAVVVLLVGIAWYALTNKQARLPAPAQSVPVINQIVPREAFIGAKITIMGSGFTSDANSLQFGEGFAYINNLTSPDGKMILFTLPESFDTCNPDGSACAEFSSRPMPGQTYEVAVINANGRSNAVTFTVAREESPPTPVPDPFPTSVPYNEDGTCPPGYVSYGIPLQCITPEYAEYCKTHPCPICLATDTLIDTPSGQVPVQNINIGMLVWTTDASGKRVAGVVVKKSRTPVPSAHQMVHMVLDDGRELFVSPGHPTSDERIVGNLTVGDPYNGASVVSVKRVPYGDGATYDILPSGETGFYWANGVLLGSTLQ